ncbi:MAG: DUF11 domain-containing protein [Proteobacteria bacterium]|jgi:hypothetical protein|nr:DUF11 domain-containing protein [Pseudomonadota bacterium]
MQFDVASLGLNNSGGDTVTLESPLGVVTSGYTYSTSEGSGDQSITRWPELTDGVFSMHLDVSSARFSPGTSVAGFLFNQVGADLEVTINDSDDPVKTNTDYSYVIDVHNYGSEEATNVTVEFTLPNFGDYVSNNQGASPPTNDVLTWNAGTLAAGGDASITVTVNAQSYGTAYACVDVSADQSDPKSNNNNDDTEATAVNRRQTDLTFELSASESEVFLGEEVVVNVKVQNLGIKLSTLCCSASVPSATPTPLGERPLTADEIAVNSSLVNWCHEVAYWLEGESSAFDDYSTPPMQVTSTRGTPTTPSTPCPSCSTTPRSCATGSGQRITRH